MNHMFHNCECPKGFTLGDKFDTSNVTYIDCMFSGCKLPDGTDATDMEPYEVVEKLRK